MATDPLGNAVRTWGTRTPWMRTICRLVTVLVSWHKAAIAEPVPALDTGGEPEARVGAAPALLAAGARTLPHAASRSEPSTTGPSATAAHRSPRPVRVPLRRLMTLTRSITLGRRGPGAGSIGNGRA